MNAPLKHFLKLVVTDLAFVFQALLPWTLPGLELVHQMLSFILEFTVGTWLLVIKQFIYLTIKIFIVLP